MNNLPPGYVLWNAKTAYDCAVALSKRHRELYDQKYNVGKRNEQIRETYKKKGWWFKLYYFSCKGTIETDKDIERLTKILDDSARWFFRTEMEHLCSVLRIDWEEYSENGVAYRWKQYTENLPPDTQVYIEVEDSSVLSRFLPK